MCENRTCQVRGKIFKTSLTVLSFTNSPTTPLNLSASFRSCRFWWCGTFPVWWSLSVSNTKTKILITPLCPSWGCTCHSHFKASRDGFVTKQRPYKMRSYAFALHMLLLPALAIDSVSFFFFFFCHQPQWRKFANYWCDTGTQLLSDSTDLSAVASQTKAHVIPGTQPAWILIKRLK